MRLPAGLFVVLKWHILPTAHTHGGEAAGTGRLQLWDKIRILYMRNNSLKGLRKVKQRKKTETVRCSVKRSGLTPYGFLLFILATDIVAWLKQKQMLGHPRITMKYMEVFGDTRWRSWLRHCATSRKVAGSIPDGVTGIFYWHNPYGRSMTLGLIHHLTEMSTRNISCG